MTLPEPGPSEGSNRPSPIAIALGIVLLLNFAAIGYFLGQRGSETTTAEAPTTTAASNADDGEPDTDEPADDEPDTDAGLDTTTTEPTTTQAPSSPADESTTTADDSDDTSADEDADDASDADAANADADAADAEDVTDADDAGDSGETAAPRVDVDEDGEAVRAAVLSGGVLFLRGSVPSVEVSEAIEGKAVAVLGEDRVVNEYVIDPDSPLPQDGEVYVEDLVLFPYGSSEINPAFTPLLDLGTALLLQNPQATLTVLAHTDADGPADYNLRLSQDRADKVAAYWIAQGVNPEQVIAIGRGEEEPIADNATADGAQANRRAEFIVSGLLN